MYKHIKGLLLGLFIIIIIFIIYIGLYYILTFLDYHNIFPTDALGRHILCFMGIIVVGGTIGIYSEMNDGK